MNFDNPSLKNVLPVAPMLDSIDAPSWDSQIGGNVCASFTAGEASLDFSNCRLGGLRLARSFTNWKEAIIKCVLSVLRVCDVFKISNAVVRLNTVFMVYLQSFRNGAEECGRYQPVNKEGLVFCEKRESEARVSLAVQALLQNPHRVLVYITADAANSTFIANLVNGFPLGYRLPYFGRAKIGLSHGVFSLIESVVMRLVRCVQHRSSRFYSITQVDVMGAGCV